MPVESIQSPYETAKDEQKSHPNRENERYPPPDRKSASDQEIRGNRQLSMMMPCTGGRRWAPLCILALAGLSATVPVESFAVAGGVGRVGLFEMTHFSSAACCADTGIGRVIPSLRAGRYDKEGTACGGIQMMGSKLPRRRRGKGPQRARWDSRTASDDPEAPQMISESTGDRMQKIEALCQRKNGGLIVVLEDPYDEGNAGAVIRSCDAFGVTEVWFVHNGLEPGTSLRPNFEREEAMILDSNDLLKSSASANRWIVSKSKRSTKAVMEELKAEGYMNVATCFTEKSVSMYGADMTSKKLALWVGNEFAGLSDLAISEADMQLFIPMRGMIQSLNLSVATAVCLSEIARQRAMSEDPDAYLLDEDQRRKMAMSLSLKRRGFKDAQGQPEKDAQRAVRLERTWNSVVDRDRSNKLARSAGAQAGEGAIASE